MYESMEPNETINQERILDKRGLTSLSNNFMIFVVQEDDLLSECVPQYGNDIKWPEVAKNIPGRTPKQCRERWKTGIAPSIDRSEFKEHEDRLILVVEDGSHSVLISVRNVSRGQVGLKLLHFSLGGLTTRSRIDGTQQFVQS
jgi:hypothetical protein